MHPAVHAVHMDAVGPVDDGREVGIGGKDGNGREGVFWFHHDFHLFSAGCERLFLFRIGIVDRNLKLIYKKVKFFDFYE